MHRNNFKHFSCKGKYLPYIIVRLAWDTKQLIEEDWMPGNHFKSPCISVKDIFNREEEKKQRDPLPWASYKTEYLGSEPCQNICFMRHKIILSIGKKSLEDTKGFSSYHFTEFFSLNDYSSSWLKVYTVVKVMPSEIHN